MTALAQRIKETPMAPYTPETKWMIPRLPVAPDWDRQEAWNRLTDKQREDATRLNLTAEDMDERTFAIIEKHLR